jgi:cyclopropane-fatty-acyl-phospholipid synthase
MMTERQGRKYALRLAGFIAIGFFTTGVARLPTPGECRGLFHEPPAFAKTERAKAAVNELLKNAGINPADLVVKDPAFYTRVLSDPLFELGETYMDGLWESEHIDQITTKLYEAQQRDGPLKSFAPLWRTPDLALNGLVKDRYRYYRDLLTNRQTRVRAMKVAEEHYDAGNGLYRRMLDPTLTYTSGVWADGFTLEDAQNAKYDLIARKLGLKPGDHVLDIGCGFGGFARFASRYYGAEVTGITISVEQLKAARALSARDKNLHFVFSDYRDIAHRFPPNTFDHVVSIEMIEAVGPKNLEGYFEAANASLKDGGRFVIQAIANNRDVVNTNPWFSKYIFSDGVAPSLNQVERASMKTFGGPVDIHRITADYDRTLLEWHKNFTAAWPELKDDYSERFKRMWDFYLLSVAGGFRSKELQLDQSVFVKGAAGREIKAIRTLPSRAKLDAMRITEEEKSRAAILIDDLDREKVAMDLALKPRPREPVKPLAKDARIAIIGAGPSGLSAALELKNQGYTNVVIFEKEAEAGGKTHTVDIGGKIHDLGATMGVKKKYAVVERLAKEHGQRTIPFPTEVDYDLKTGRPVAPSRGDALKKKVQGLVYLLKYNDITRDVGKGLEIPPVELADPWQVVMNRHGLGYFGEQLKTYLTGYGYGGPETPAVFAMRMFDPDAIVGAALSDPIMWENGTQPIWKGVASQLNVRLNTTIEKVERSETGIKISVQGGTRSEHFDRLIVATDPKSALKVLDPTAEEKSLFTQVKYMPYATFAVRVDGIADGVSQVGYLRENMTLDREGHPMAWIKRHGDDNVFVFHLFAPDHLSDDQILANISEDLGRLGGRNFSLVDSRRWPFFPHVDGTSMRENHWYERVVNNQGRNGTVFVNEAMNMSTMADAAALGKKVAERMISGEYGP